MKRGNQAGLAALLFCASIVLFCCSRTSAAGLDTIEKGIFIDQVDVSGMTPLEAEAAVNAYVGELGAKKITLNALNDNKVVVSAKELGLKWSNHQIVTEAGQLGKSGNIVQRYKALKDLEHENKVFPMDLSFDDNAIRRILEEKTAAYNVEPVDGTLTREDGEFVYTPGQTGVEIDINSSVEVIRDSLSQIETEDAITVDLAAQTTEPRGSEEQLTAVKDVLGTFTTSFSSSGANRSGNLKNGASKINGTLLYPGEEFSTYETVSPFTEENGYFMAGAYNAGLVVDSLGGGICQVSTTLYNAALRAELEITQRQNHSMIVNYVEPSEDAAISGTEKDMRFVNNTDYPIYIEGYTSPDKHITFTIYGHETRPSNRKVSYESKVLSRTEPTGEKVVGDPSQRAGYVSVQSAHVGYTAELWKIVTVDGKEESRTLVNSSKYNAVPRTAAVGTATSDPAASAAIRAALATGSIESCRAAAASINAGTVSAPQSDVAAQAQAAHDAAVKAQQEALQEALRMQQEAIRQQQEAAAAAAAGQ